MSNVRKNFLALLQNKPLKPDVASLSIEEMIARCKAYPTLNALLTYHQSQGIMVIDSFALGVSLTSMAYLYSHSYEVGTENVTRKMSLNLFTALVANTGYQKTGYLSDCRTGIISLINNIIKDKYAIAYNSLTTYLPSSGEGFQKLCGEMPVRIFLLDESKQYLKAREDSPKYHVFEATRHLFDPHIFGLSVTKNSDNNNKETDRSIATMLIAGTTEDMKKYLLSKDKLEDGTANRYLVICPSSTRTGSRKPFRLEKSFLEDCCFSVISEKAKNNIFYEVEKAIGEGLEAIAKIKRTIKYIYNEEIEAFFEVIVNENKKILDDYDENKIEVDPKIIMLTRQIDMKKRIAYLLWLDSDLKNPFECAKDAHDIVNILNTTCENLYETKVGTIDVMKKKIMALREKKKVGDIIYLSSLTREKGTLDYKVYGNIYPELAQYLRSLSTIDQISLIEKNKSIIAFTFNPENQ